MLIGAPWNRDPYPVATGIATNGTAAVALVSDDTPRTKPRTSATLSFHGTLFHQGLKHGRLVLLPGRQDNGHQLAVPFDANVDLGREPAATSSQGFGDGVPFFAPAACWWARIVVPST